jgi:acetyl esterase/lipase
VGDNRPVPQLINLEDSFAEAGLVVMGVTTPGLLSYTLTPGDADGIVQAFQALAQQPGVNPHALGIIALSAGSGVACLAAADPRIRDRVAFVTLFGGFFDAADLVQDVGQRFLNFDGHTEAWHPQLVPLQVLANSVAVDLPPGDAGALENAFSPTFVPIAPTTLATYSPAMQATYHLLAGDEPALAMENLARLPGSVHMLLANLSPRSVLPQIHAKIFLLHDRHDQYVPFTESRHFAAALQAAGHPHEYVEFNIFQHVEVKGDLPLGELIGDGAHLFGLLDAVLSYGG